MSLVLFRNGKLFDGLGAETRDGLEVLVEDDRIKEISDRPISASNARVVDLGGRTLMPGLIDAHFHAVAADPNIGNVENMPASLIAQYSRGFLEASLGRGFTTIRALGTLIRFGNNFLFSGEWWMTIFPGLALVILALAVNLLGDWLRDALNPKLR
jgi:imidazolonepropionase-like amidohydrolase